MLKVTATIIRGFYYFLLEIMIDRKEEKMFSSYEFSSRKWIFVIILLLSVIGNFVLMDALYSVSAENISFRTSYVEIQLQLHNCNQIVITPITKPTQSER